MISHNLADVFEVADRIFVLRLGRAGRRLRRRSRRPRSTSSRRSPGRRRQRNSERDGERRRRHERPAAADRRRGGGAPAAAAAETLRRIVQGDLASVRVVLGLAVIWIIFQVAERPLPLGREPDQPDAADHGDRPDLGRRRLRAAARRDRPLGRRGQRPRRRGDGRAQRQARLEPLPGDRRRGRASAPRSACCRARCSAASACPPSSSPWPACWPGRGRSCRCSGSTGSINITDPKITGLANTFYSDAVGWIFAAVVIAAYARRRSRSATGAASPPGLDGRRASAGADRPLRARRRGRRSPPSRSSTPTAACRWRC